MLELEEAMDSSLSIAEMESITKTYRQRHSVIILIRLLNRLVTAIQRHRGVSLALLAGDGLFVEDAAKVEAEINKRLWVLRNSCFHYDELVPEHVQENIQQSWRTVCHDWEEDALLENFEYHSFLIDQLLQLSGDLTRRLGEPMASECGLADDTLSKVANPLSDWVLSLVSRGIPQLVEHLAKIRGLATHSAVVGECDEEHDKKLRYWLQCAEQENRELIRQIDTMDSTIRNSWKSLNELKNYELKLAFFLNTISKDIIYGDCSRSDARSLFILGTEIIDAYVEGVDGGINLLLRVLETEMESWLSF